KPHPTRRLSSSRPRRQILRSSCASWETPFRPVPKKGQSENGRKGPPFRARQQLLGALQRLTLHFQRQPEFLIGVARSFHFSQTVGKLGESGGVAAIKSGIGQCSLQVCDFPVLHLDAGGQCAQLMLVGKG